MFYKPTQNANIVHVRELGLILHGLVHSLETKKMHLSELRNCKPRKNFHTLYFMLSLIHQTNKQVEK